MNQFKRSITKNCKKFFKYHYQLKKKVDQNLIDQLETFGFLEVFRFSEFSKMALDTFKVKFEYTLELEGAIEGEYVMVTILRSCHEYVNEFETIINNWSQTES